MIGAHVTLRTRSGEPRERDRARMARMAGRAGADRAIGIRFSDAVTLFAAADHRRSAFERHKRMWRPLRISGLIRFREGDLFGTETFLAVNRRPGNTGVPAAQELLVNAFVATAAVSRRQLRHDRETVMFLALLVRRGLMAIEATYPFPRMHAHFVFVDDRVLLRVMASGALAGGADIFGVWLLCFDVRTLLVYQERGYDERETENKRDENGSKAHAGKINSQPRGFGIKRAKPNDGCPHVADLNGAQVARNARICKRIRAFRHAPHNAGECELLPLRYRRGSVTPYCSSLMVRRSFFISSRSCWLAS